MKKLINTTIRSLLVYALPIILFASTLLGFNMGYTPSNDTPEAGSNIEFVMEEEDYIDDIPFDTETVAINVRYERSQMETFPFDDEVYVDDIPFNTNKIAVEAENSYALVN